jgi:hypothetical protein
MNMMAEKTEEVVEQSYVLGPQDRCDSCSAEALIWVNGVAGELLFCGHHYNKHEEKLKDYAFEIIDERSKLVQNRAIGSEN